LADPYPSRGYKLLKRKKKKEKDPAKIKLGRLSRRKGHNFEREIAIFFRNIFPEARRHLEYQDAEANGVDLVHTGPFKIQCKRGRKYSSLQAIKEITANELIGDIPLLITQGDHERILVALPLEDFIRLAEIAYPADGADLFG
jgi:hypothetical protein